MGRQDRGILYAGTGSKEGAGNTRDQETREIQEKQEVQDTRSMRNEIDNKSFYYEMRETIPGENLIREAGVQYAFRQVEAPLRFAQRQDAPSMEKNATRLDGAKRGQGEYTLEDYYALPDDQRVELIDGVIYDMSASYTTHQIASFEISTQLAAYIKSQKGLCQAFYAPVDVQLDCDDRTMLQPDVLVVCDRDKIRKRCVYGAPDFVIEILSDSTARKDTTIKLWKYLHAGVREYWIVDLQAEKVIVYDRIGEEYRTVIYGMDQPVPVQIFDGECQIHFDEICEEVRMILAQP